MLDDLKAALGDLGLSPKEADVYISMLELGPASVQDVSKRAGVNRSTTYVMIEGLKRLGLVSTFEKGKKILFVPESPERLKNVINLQIQKLRDKDDKLADALPQLLAIFASWKDKPRVRYFEGEAAIHDILNEVAAMSEREEILEIYSVDEHLMEIVKLTKERRAKTEYKATARGIACIKPGFHQPYFIQKPNHELRTLDYKMYPFTGDMSISKGRIIMYSLKTTAVGIIIESADLADFMRSIFNICWTLAKPWTPPADWSPEKHLPS